MKSRVQQMIIHVAGCAVFLVLPFLFSPAPSHSFDVIHNPPTQRDLPKSAAAIGLGIDSLHKTPRVIPVLPVGMGLRYMLTSQMAITGEFTYRLTATDYLDGFSYAGNAQKKDYYYEFSIGVSYRFGNDRLGCPKIRK